MEPARLSSPSTAWYKFGLPGAGVAGMLVLALILFVLRRELGGGEAWLLVLPLVFVIGTCVVFRRLKVVDLTDDAFVVTGWSRKIVIPLAEVKDVGGNPRGQPEVVWLDLRTETEFGSRIEFVPPSRGPTGVLKLWLGMAVSEHPMVTELRALVEGRSESAAVVRPGVHPRPRRVTIRLVVTVASVLLIGVMAMAEMFAKKSSKPYRAAVAAVQASAKARWELGMPAVPGWLVDGSLGESSADLAFAVSGPHREGRVRVRASRVGGRWVVYSLVLEVDGKTFDLLQRQDPSTRFLS